MSVKRHAFLGFWRKHLFMWQDSFVCVTGLMCMCDVTHLYEWCDSYIRETWLLHKCAMTHLYVWYDSLFDIRKESFICVTCLMHTWHDSCTYVWRDSFNCLLQLIHVCDMTRFLVFDMAHLNEISHVKHQKVSHITYTCETKKWIMWHTCAFWHGWSQ